MYRDLCIYGYVRFDYYRNRFLMWHRENVHELVALVPSLKKYERYLG